MIRKFTLTGMLCGLMAHAIIAQEQANPPRAVDMLLSKSYEERQQGRKMILEQRARLVSELMRIITQPGNYSRRGESVRDAMAMLGELRAAEASETLAKHIGFPLATHPETGEQGPLHRALRSPELKGSLPAIAALVKIGEPSLDAIIDKLQTAESSLERRACQEVLKQLNPRCSVRARLQTAMDKADQSSRERLRQTLELLKDEFRRRAKE